MSTAPAAPAASFPTSRPLRILHLTAGSDAGGLSRYIFDLCSAMHAQGHSVAVTGEKGAWHSLFESAPFPWIEAPLKGSPLALYRATRQVRSWLRAHEVDLLHVHYRRSALVARRLARFMDIPLLYTLHLSDIPLGGPWRFLTDFGDHTHVASEDARQWLITAARVPPDRITLIPHGIHPDRFPVTDAASRSAARQRLGISEDAIVAAFVGRLDDPKNEDWILDLAAATRSSLPDAVFLLAGDGPHEPAVRARVAAENLAGRVRLLGHVDPLPVYQAADALLLPSLREGFSLVCAEAMSTGVPVLRTRTAGTTELILENVTGRSVDISHDAFLAAARQFLSDRAALRTMGRAAADHVRRNLTFDLQLSRTLDLYRRLAKQ